ncbi:MAG: hypothetical protein WBQ23_06965 [Bacteroidota bacterium]
MRTRIFFMLFIAVMTSTAVGQEAGKDFGIKLSGFVKSDIFYDSRQTVSIREGHFNLYPANEMLDANGDDLNASPSFNMLSIQTRVNAKITGPDAFGAKASGVIEGEFFGTSDADVNGFRMRHAMAILDWESASLLVGQTWHPMFVTEVFPGVISFNTGVPFQPFSRNPQIRFTKNFGGLKLIAAAMAERDFQSYGPDAAGNSVASSSFLRNSVIPNLHFQAQYAGGGHIFGAGVDYKKLKPRLSNAMNVKVDESVTGISALGYAKLDLAPLTLKLEGVLGNNLADLLMLGGYAVNAQDSIAIPNGYPTVAIAQEYSTINCYSVWGELIYGKDIELAVFAGYTQNLGAENALSGKYYARGSNIHSISRVAPRIQWTSGKMRIATELEYTAADYGTPVASNKGLVENTKSISNMRLLVAVYYFF